MPQISEDDRWEELPTTMKTAYRTRRSQTRTRKRPIPQCGFFFFFGNGGPPPKTTQICSTARFLEGQPLFTAKQGSIQA